MRAKICGLATEDAVAAAVAGGAAFLGFVFYERSPRSISPEQAAALCRAVPSGVSRVGLFVDADDSFIGKVLAAVPLDLLQFHGRESPKRVVEVKKTFRLPVMKAIPVGDVADLAVAAAYLDAADWLLFDARPPSRPNALPGGNGLVFDWQLLQGRSWPIPWMLSGGLTAASLAEAVRLTGARVVDVSSGVEKVLGHKDPGKIADFLATLSNLPAG